MNKPLISVIINCFNGEQFLEEAIQSVVNQTYTNWELIFWDNQSEDNSKNIYSKFSDPRLNYYYAEEHTTLGRARNLAIEKAKGEWIGFLDVDDLWWKDKLEKQVSLIDSDTQIGFIYGKSDIIFSNNENKRISKIEDLPEGDIFEDLLKDNFVNYLSALINKEKLAKIPKIPDNFNQVEDYYIFLHLSKSYKVRALQEICCSYRLHDNNLSRREPIKGAKESLMLIKSFLSGRESKKALANKLSSLAIAQIREKEFINALRTLSEGGFISFIQRILIYIFR